jgi:hypothetical protein
LEGNGLSKWSSTNMKGGISSCFLFFVVSGSSWYVCGMGVDGLVLALTCA